MLLTLSDDSLSFAEKRITGKIDFPIDKDIQIIALSVWQMVQKKYCIGKTEIMSAVGEDCIDFAFAIKPRVLSPQLEALLEAKRQKMQTILGEDASLYELKVQYMQGKHVHICCFPLQLRT